MRKVACGEPCLTLPSVAQKRGLDVGLRKRWSLDVGKNSRASSHEFAVLAAWPQSGLVPPSLKVWAREGAFCPEVGCALPGSSPQKEKRSQPQLQRARDVCLSTFYCEIPEGWGQIGGCGKGLGSPRGHQN